MRDELLKTQKRIAKALERIADVMEDEREDYVAAVEEAAASVNPDDCPHPDEHRVERSSGAFIQVGCSLCGAANVHGSTASRFRAATGLR